MGGGPALTLSHELDLAIWLFGKVNKVVSMKNYNSNLEIDTEHAIDILISFESGITGNIHLDYFQKNRQIYFKLYLNKKIHAMKVCHLWRHSTKVQSCAQVLAQDLKGWKPG